MARIQKIVLRSCGSRLRKVDAMASELPGGAGGQRESLGGQAHDAVPSILQCGDHIGRFRLDQLHMGDHANGFPLSARFDESLFKGCRDPILTLQLLVEPLVASKHLPRAQDGVIDVQEDKSPPIHVFCQIGKVGQFQDPVRHGFRLENSGLLLFRLSAWP